MKASFELTLGSNGRPCIKFRHYDKDGSLDQRVLKSFIELAKEKGLVLKNPSGYIDTDGNSWENYEIRIDDK